MRRQVYMLACHCATCLPAWKRACCAAVLQVCLRTCRCVCSPGMRCSERLAWPPAKESHSHDARGLSPTLFHEYRHVSLPRALLIPCACARLGAGLRARLVKQCCRSAAPAAR